jgi:hypothetical protein
MMMMTMQMMKMEMKMVMKMMMKMIMMMVMMMGVGAVCPPSGVKDLDFWAFVGSGDARVIIGSFSDERVVVVFCNKVEFFGSILDYSLEVRDFEFSADLGISNVPGRIDCVPDNSIFEGLEGVDVGSGCIAPGD